MAEGKQPPKRQNWGTRLGVVLAVAGSAVGLGNFLRFPSVATQNGGGAFMIPYFVAFLLLGIPMCWVEWGMGRYGGRFSHGSAPGIFDAVSGRKPFVKYLGVIGLMGPLMIFFYYVYIESWTLGYAYYSLTGKLTSITSETGMKAFLNGYQGVEKNEYFSSKAPAYLFFLITFALNFGVLYMGIVHGIERVSKIAMPLLAILGTILAVRVLTLGAPNAAHPDWNVNNGLGFLWNPDFSKLGEAKVWLAAAGQIFFSLSAGFGVILSYASYLRSKDDVALSSVTAAGTNTLMEVVIAGTMVIPAAVVFYGMSGAVDIANAGLFDLGFVIMPMIFMKMGWTGFFSLAWFLLLFISGVTSSISLLQPSISFFQDEYRFSQRKSVLLVAAICFVFAHLTVLGAKGFIDEMDLWGTNLSLVLCSLIEVILFAWVLGIDRSWGELHQGAEIRIPVIFKFIIKYITPLLLIVILATFLWQNFKSSILMEGYGETWAERMPVVWLRLALVGLVGGLLFLIRYSWKRYPKQMEPSE